MFMYFFTRTSFFGTISSFREGNPCILSTQKHLPGARLHLFHVLSNRHQFLHLLEVEISSMWFLKNVNNMSENGDFFFKCFMTHDWFRFLNLQTFHFSFGTYETATRVTVIFDTLLAKKKRSNKASHFTESTSKNKPFPPVVHIHWGLPDIIGMSLCVAFLRRFDLDPWNSMGKITTIC